MLGEKQKEANPMIRSFNVVATVLLLSMLFPLGCTLVPTVENGAVIELAVIRTEEFQQLIVPEKWEIEEATEPGNEIHLKITKRLAYAGAPGESVYLDEIASGMGVAQQAEGTTLKLRDFGEFSTHSGGTLVSVSMVVPKNIQTKTIVFENLGRHNLDSEWKAVDSTILRREVTP